MSYFSQEDLPTSPGSQEEGSGGGNKTETNTAETKSSVLTRKSQRDHSDSSDGNSSPKSHITASP